jgi:hypothetical protein
VEWPAAFYDWRAGTGCPVCEEGRPESTPHAVRFFAGEVSDAYLVRADIQRGLAMVVWRGRHVAEPTQLSDPEAAAYGREVLHADPDPPPMPEDRLMRDVEALRRATRP